MGFCANCGAETEGMKRLCDNCSIILGGADNEPEPQVQPEPMVIESEPQVQPEPMVIEPEPQVQPETFSYTQDTVYNGTVAQDNTVYNEPQSNQNFDYNMGSSNMEVADYFKTMGLIFVKPFACIKEKSVQLSSIKNSGIMVLIITVIITLINLFKTMFNAVVEKKYNFWEGTYSTEIEFSNLKDLEYLKILGSTFITWIAIIAIIAGVYFIASLIIKKQTSFPKLLGVSTLAIIPFVVSLIILSPLLSLMHSMLGTLVTIIGFVYTSVIIYEAMNDEIRLEADKKCYFNLICLSIIISASMYIYMKMLMSSLSSLSSLMNLF